MSIIQFNAVKAQERRIESLLNAEFPAVIRALEPHSHDAALTVQALQDELRRQWHDFSSAERKLNIAVIGGSPTPLHIPICWPPPGPARRSCARSPSPWT